MILRPCPIPDWPKLAWVASMAAGRDAVVLRHGPMVEVRGDWAAEAVWTGDFSEGGFDRVELVYGTGVRIRDGRAVFVSSATGVDRLWHCRLAETWHVSNSLPGLLAVAGISLKDDYRSYAEDIWTAEGEGIRSYKPSIPASPVDVQVVYFQSLAFEGGGLEKLDRPDDCPHFACYEEYYAFLVSTAQALAANMTSPARRQVVTPFVGISSGYDSPATAVIARHAGCTRAATIVNATSCWTRSDSGEEIAARLGLQCACYRHRRDLYRHEESVWAAAGRSGGLNLTLFDYPGPLCLFFNGSYGDRVWDGRPHDLSEPVGDTDSLLGEFRLIVGMLQTVVPWWGIRRAQEINALGQSEAMNAWRIGGGYDRPVARRIVEEAGVPRGLFGVSKKNTSSNDTFRWPFGRRSMESFAEYLGGIGIRPPSAAWVAILRRYSRASSLLYKNTFRRWGWGPWYRPWWKFEEAWRRLFQWGNLELKAVYERGLKSPAAPPDGASRPCGMCRLPGSANRA